ncbi:MAG: hypothetical protein KAI24_04685 [Planctomycetes bacterium]|nr:hypothetical protein [Planctomycetota bacterium]
MADRRDLTDAPPRPAFGWRGAVSLLIGAGALIALMVYLVPAASHPVGYDVFRSLWIARTWAESGFPDAMPSAAFTGLEHHFGDQQLGFDWLVALVGGSDLDESVVPPMIWALVGLQGVALWLAARALRRDASPLWMLLLPAVSQTWMFRCTTLRTMLLSSSLVLLVIVVATLRAQRAKVRPHWLLLATAAFGYCHGAVVLPIVLWSLSAIGARLANGPGGLPWRDGPWVLLGVIVSGVVRPDFPANLRVWADLNLGTPWAALQGELEVRPFELLPLGVGDLLATEWTFLLGGAACVWLAVTARDRRRWPLLLPTMFMIVAALLSRRMMELATPMIVLYLAVTWRGGLRWWAAAALFALGVVVHVPTARAGAEANRIRELVPVADWLCARARPGDLVFVTDWGVSSPLTWYTRGHELRFTGMIDPVFMWSHHPELWQAWQQVKLVEAADPFDIVRHRFGARFVAFSIADAPAHLPPGSTANSLREALAREVAAGHPVEAFVVYPDRPADPANWVVVDLAPQ